MSPNLDGACVLVGAWLGRDEGEEEGEEEGPALGSSLEEEEGDNVDGLLEGRALGP